VKENSVYSLHPSGRTLDRRAAGNTGIGAMRAGRIRSSKNKTPFNIIRAGHCCGAAQRQYPAVVCHINRQSTLGRKSNKKKGRLELRTAFETEQRRQKLIAYLIVISGVALFIWGILLFDRTFIYLQTQIFITLIGSVIGIISLHFLWRHKNYGLIATIFYGFFLGGPIPYCRDNKTHIRSK